MLTQSFLIAPAYYAGQRFRPNSSERNTGTFHFFVFGSFTRLWFPSQAGYSPSVAIPSALRAVHPQISNPSPAHTQTLGSVL